MLLAARQAIDTAVAMTGDADLAPAFERVRAEGIRIVLTHPSGTGKSVSPGLLSLRLWRYRA